MVKLLLTNIMDMAGIDPKSVKLIRHAQSDATFKKCMDYNMVREYTCAQRTGFSKGYDYWMVFVSREGTTAILDSFYKVNGSQPISQEFMTEGFPVPTMYEEEGTSFFNLQKLDVLKEFENRLIIDWGKGTRMWHQKGTTEKEVLAIQAEKKYPFTNYEDIILPYAKLKEIIYEPILYSDWHTALSAVKGIYLITDTITGKQYVGSAYGDNGILGRWTEYVETKHGGNKKLRELLKEDSNRYKSFRFSILQVLPKAITDDGVIAIENRYKDKLLTREFGLNDN